MSEPASEAVVVDIDAGSSPSEPASDAPDVIVVDTGDSNGGATDGELDLAGRVGRLEAQVEQLRVDVSEAQLTADIAETVAENAAEEAVTAEVIAEAAAVEAVEAETEAETEPEDDSPAKPHFMHRSFGDLFGRNS